MAIPMENRMARLEGAYEQVSDRLNSIDRRLESFAESIDRRFLSVDSRFDALDRKVDANFRWLAGILFGSWITTISAVLFHR